MWHSCAIRALSIPKEGVQIRAKEAGPTGKRQDRESSAELPVKQDLQQKAGQQKYHYLNKLEVGQ